jgi:hypothetical protein
MENLNNIDTYKIRVQGRFRNTWKNWLDGELIRIEQSHENQNHTIITVAAQDQAALRGVLNKLWDVNLTIISFYQTNELNGESNENKHNFILG